MFFASCFELQDVSRVADMSSMFLKATNFNQDLFFWNVARVTSMEFMFKEAEAFDHDLRNWNVKKVSTFKNMFEKADAFNADLSKWDLTSATVSTSMQNMFKEASSFDRTLCGDKWSSGNAFSTTNGRSGCCNAGSYLVNPHHTPFSATDGDGACNTYDKLSIHNLGKNPLVFIFRYCFCIQDV